MKNHFFIGYAGNKREEVKNIYDYLDLNNKEYIDTIIEPFCGTSSLSYYIWLNNKEKNYKYILNDNNPFLIELYNTAKDNEKLIKFHSDLLILYKSVFDVPKEKQKELYMKINVNENLLNWFFKNKFFTIRAGLFPLNHIYSVNKLDIVLKAPIINFLRNADITILSEPGIDIYKKYCNNKNCLLFLDPPYLIASNSFYKDPISKIYEYLFDNSIINNIGFTVLCLENNWIIKLLFKDNKNIKYDKNYNTSSSIKREHIIISN